MWHAVSFALLDSINVLLIGVIVVVGIILPPTAKYRRVVSLLIAGDWTGVFVLALLTMFVFDGIEQTIAALLKSPLFGALLIALGLVGAVFTYRGGDSSAIMQRLLPPLKKPTAQTFLAGFVLGFVQSITSLPFFAGIAFMSVAGYSVAIRYGGMVAYASLALSLPTLCAVLVGMVRAYPESPVGRLFSQVREHRTKLSLIAGYLVSVVLVIMGIAHL